MKEKLTQIYESSKQSVGKDYKETTGMMMLKSLDQCLASFYEAQENKDFDAKQHNLGGSLYID